MSQSCTSVFLNSNKNTFHTWYLCMCHGVVHRVALSFFFSQKCPCSGVGYRAPQVSGLRKKKVEPLSIVRMPSPRARPLYSSVPHADTTGAKMQVALSGIFVVKRWDFSTGKPSECLFLFLKYLLVCIPRPWVCSLAFIFSLRLKISFG